ncbi:MAG TPA: class I SAM-dependent methyltransferase [Urbifossiella sp.]
MTIDLPLPPEQMDFVGGGDFDEIGRQFLGHFIDFGGLKPHHRVLDVGCGIGRMARPLTAYLDRSGSYEGFDVVGVGIDWCRRTITPRFPNFRFQRANVFSPGYHPRGLYEGADYVFPFPDNSFDFVFLTSVFTHMRPAEVANYAREIGRVLKLGGKCLSTFFLQTPETRALSKAGQGELKFVHRRVGYWIAFPDVADEEAICFDEPDVLSLYEQCGLAVAGPIHRGAWCGRSQFVSFQDIVVAEKVRSIARARSVPGARMMRAVIGKLRRRWRRKSLLHSVALNNVRRAEQHAA